MNLTSCRSLFTWLLALPLQAAPLPQLALPVRELPSDVQQYVSILCGDLCLIRSSTSGEEVSKIYRSVDNGWQVIENHLPFIKWPTISRDGLLAYRFWKEQGTVSSIVDANSGQLLWEDLSPGNWEDFSAGYHVAFRSGTLTVHDRFGGSAAHACPAVGSPYASRISGNEIVYLYSAGGGVQVRRQNLITGGILDS